MHGPRLLALILSAALLTGCAAVAPRDAAPLPVIDTGPVAEVKEYDATLSGLALSNGTLDQIFQPGQPSYTSTQGFLVTRLRVHAQTTDPDASLAIAGAPLVRGRGAASIGLAPGANRVPIVVTAADGITSRSYELVVERQGASDFAQHAYIKASNTDSNDLFGYSVAVSGDVLAVGAYLEDSFASGIDSVQADNSADGSGAVYVFRRHGRTWTQEAYVKSSNTASGHQFGRAIALAGDTLAVGAPFEGSAATGVDPPRTEARARDSGAVYVIRRHGGSWAQEAYIKASNTTAGDLFGSSVALSGDTLAVGAYLEDSAATGIDGNQADRSAENSGAVYVFDRSGGSWAQKAYVKASNTHAGDRFGYGLALSGDTLAVGAYMEGGGAGSNQRDRSAPNSGAVYVYARGARGWAQEAYIKAPDAARNDLFGSSVALSRDTLAVGAPLEDGKGGENSGAVYVYTRRNGIWSQQAYLKASPAGANHRFGSSAALEEDTLAVGAYLEDSHAFGLNPGRMDERSPDSGAVYVFTRSGGNWTQGGHIKASDARAGDMFGFSVSVSGDLLAAGAPNESSSATGIDGSQAGEGAPGGGAVYLFR